MKIPRRASDLLVKDYLKYTEYIKTDPTDRNDIVKIEHKKYNKKWHNMILIN